MKKNLAIVVGVLVSTVMFAGGIKDPVTGLAVVKKTGTSTFKVFYKNAEENDVKISIVNKENIVVFSERIKSTDGFVRPYNLSELGEGEYTFQIEDSSGVKKEHISYKAGKVDNLFNIVKLTQGNRYLVTAPNKANQIVTVKIYDSTGDLLYNESSKLSEDFAKVYKLDQISGAITFEVLNSEGASKVFTF